ERDSATTQCPGGIPVTMSDTVHRGRSTRRRLVPLVTPQFRVSPSCRFQPPRLSRDRPVFSAPPIVSPWLKLISETQWSPNQSENTFASIGSIPPKTALQPTEPNTV